ncbi:MAG TPA: S9 family peptidase [Luteimonas sp.]|nr:S9 family peptidase [Luteimonas sp.]
MRSLVLAGLLLACAGVAHASGGVDVAAFIKNDGFDALKLSPHGEYYAASALLDDRSVLLVLRRSDSKVVARLNLGAGKYVYAFDWVNPTLVMVTMAEKIGALDKPLPTANLYTVNAETQGVDILVGQDVRAMSTGTHIETKKQEEVAAVLVDDLPNDDDNVLVSVQPFQADAYSRVEKMNVHSGKRALVVRSPVRNAGFATDHQGVVRFAYGVDRSSDSKLFYRAGDGAEWTEINDERADGHAEWPIGFSADDAIAYLEVEQAAGPDAIVAFEPATGKRTQVFRDQDSDPTFVITTNNPARAPIGVGLMDGKPRTAFFTAATGEEKLYRSLEAAFAGSAVYVTSTTNDGTLALVRVTSDRNPGDFYLFDTVAKKASLALSRRDWIDPEQMSEKRPVAFAARDGMNLHGYVTFPKGAGDKHLPMVVLPHGGPFGIAEGWNFDNEAQMLASAGYAVLQVDFRGSGLHGRAYQQAGAREWGRKMQDDVTDATRWAIAQQIADPGRICIYGASYGAYASLMGAAREPALYKCAAGYVGVYDLPLMVSNGENPSDSGKAWSRQWVGESPGLLDISPVNMADKIKIPVFLAAGGQDKVAPIEHSQRMEKALRAANVPVETLYFRTEGHGFFVDEHRQAFYTQLLAFLNRNIGGALASSATASAAAGSAASH